MSTTELINSFEEIRLESSSDKIIRQVRQLITSGQLNPGDRLPSERKLSERLGVSRGHVRDAIKKLEFYGILKTLPQSGTVVAGIGINALEGLISDVLKIENSDFAALVETRVMLETESAKLAAIRRTDKNILDLGQALKAYARKLKSGKPVVEEDLMFHLNITEATQNTVLKSLMLIITPDIIKNFIQLDICNDQRTTSVLQEHERILQHIIEKNPEGAAAAMRTHLKDVSEYSRGLKNRQTKGIEGTL